MLYTTKFFEKRKKKMKLEDILYKNSNRISQDNKNSEEPTKLYLEKEKNIRNPRGEKFLDIKNKTTNTETMIPNKYPNKKQVLSLVLVCLDQFKNLSYKTHQQTLELTKAKHFTSVKRTITSLVVLLLTSLWDKP